MPSRKKKVWSTGRKLAGNILPLVLAVPLLAQALRLLASEGPSVTTLLWAASFPVTCWVLLALMGFVGNGGMRREMSKRMHHERPFDQEEKYFVGFAKPTYKSALDPHEDVGFLVLHSGTIEFWGSEVQVSLAKQSVAGIRYRPNAHTVVGLGRWISIEAVVEEKPVRMLIEPRVKATLIGNLIYSKSLFKRLREWKDEEPLASARGSSKRSTELEED